MSTLLNNAKLFLKASVPATIPALGMWKFSSSLHLPHLHQYLVVLDFENFVNLVDKKYFAVIFICVADYLVRSSIFL